MSIVFHSLSLVASAGGGGSGGSSGGSGSGGGGIIGAYYAVAYWLTARFKRKLPTIVAVLLVSVMMLLLTLIFVSDLVLWIVIVVASGLGIHSGVVGLIGKFRGQSKKAKAALAAAQQVNSTEWSEPTIKARTDDVFMRFQRDWTNGDLDAMHAYLTPAYLAHVTLMILAMKQMERVNVMADVVIRDSAVTNVDDEVGSNADRLDVAFQAGAHDSLVQAGATLYSQTADFIETWHFVQENDTWMLNGITPATVLDAMVVASLQDFARQNGLYFSPNWGRLLLPQHGRLFKDAGFTLRTRVDNHVIGMWDKLLVQLYTYTSQANMSLVPTARLVGQLTLPRSYGGIIVEDKRTASRNFIGLPLKPKGYTKYTLEWGDFNKRYNLYATDADKYVSFELLNPAFMAWLYDYAEHISIEVVDSIVYIYCKPETGSPDQYKTMLEVLKRAYAELKR